MDHSFVIKRQTVVSNVQNDSTCLNRHHNNIINYSAFFFQSKISLFLLPASEISGIHIPCHLSRDINVFFLRQCMSRGFWEQKSLGPGWNCFRVPVEFYKLIITWPFSFCFSFQSIFYTIRVMLCYVITERISLLCNLHVFQ